MGLEKAQIEVVHTRDRISVQYNPEEYTVNKDNNFATQAIPGLPSPLVQFVNGNQRTVEMELLFDTWDTPTLSKTDVRDLTSRVVSLLDIDSQLHAPPILRLSWASLTMLCVLSRVVQKFVMFDNGGRPVRARLTCTFNEVIDPEQEAKALNLQTADYSKVHVVSERETLASIAALLYDDPAAWRPIAIANRLDDPRGIAVGQQLRVPSLPFVDPDSREVVR
jgi:nucleoid-associated protein YgaU